MSEKHFIPEDVNTEKSLVSCVHAGFGSQDASSDNAIAAVEPEAFLDPQSRCIWAAMRSLYQAGQPINPSTIWCEVQRLDLASVFGGYSALFEALSYNEFGNPEPLVGRVSELHARRGIMQIGSDLSRKAADLSVDHQEVISEASSRLMLIAGNVKNIQTFKGGDMVNRLASLDPFRNAGSSQKLFYFPFESWNREVECAPGHVVIVGAAAKTGKTSFIIDSMAHTAEKGIKSGFISLEMDRDEVESRLSARFTGLDARTFLSGTWTHEQIRPALQKADVIARLCWWCHPSGLPWAKVEAQIREMVRVFGAQSVVIDYFTLVGKPTGNKSASDASLWGQLSTAIKRLAQSLNICIVLICQLNREGAEGEPFKHNLRETGQLEQDANAIIFFWKENEKVFGKVSDNRSGASVPRKELQVHFPTCRFKMPENETGYAPSKHVEFPS